MEGLQGLLLEPPRVGVDQNGGHELALSSPLTVGPCRPERWPRTGGRRQSIGSRGLRRIPG